MKYLQILNWVLFAAGLLMAVVMAVVSLILLIYQQEASDIGSDVPRVLFTFGAFSVFSLIAGLASWSLYRRQPWMWIGQGALAIAVGGMLLLAQTLG